MEPEERIAEQFLTTHFGKKPDYEPLGKSRPPDFSIGTTAFEVRRLNQQFSIGGKSQGLEELLFALLEAIPAELDRIPSSPKVGSFFYRLSFKRPLHSSPSRIAKKIARQARRGYFQGLEACAIEVDNVTVEIFPSGIASDKAFLLGICKDHDASGRVPAIYLRPLQLALDEKAAKTKAIVQTFSAWILVLVNAIPGTIGPGDIGPLDLNLHHFRCVAVLNREGSLTLELPYKSLSVSL